MPFERRLLVGALVAWLVVALLAIAWGPSLGHDEAAFAVAARGGGPAWLYRSVGVIQLAKLGVWLGGAEWQLRLVSAALGPCVVLATWLVARAAFDTRIAAWSAAVIAGAHPMVLRSAELIGDLPATAAVLVGVAVITAELARPDGPRWRLVAAAPALAAGFYLRYGNAPVIAMIAGVAAALWWRSIARRPVVVAVTALTFAALIAPHAIQSLRATGSLLGILEFSASVPRRAYLGEGLVTYAEWVPQFWFGALVTPLMLAGIVALVRPPAARRPTLFLGAIAVGQIVAIGIKSHAQPRYIFIATALLVVLGVELVARVLRPRRRLALGLVAGAWLGAAVAIVPFQLHLAYLRAPLRSAARAIADDAHGKSCAAICKVVTQLMWYTGCEGTLLRDPTRLPDQLRYGTQRTSFDAIYTVSVPHATTMVEPVVIGLGARGADELVSGDERAQLWRIEQR
jgi:hypothetical protein